MHVGASCGPHTHTTPPLHSGFVFVCLFALRHSACDVQPAAKKPEKEDGLWLVLSWVERSVLTSQPRWRVSIRTCEPLSVCNVMTKVEFYHQVPQRPSSWEKSSMNSSKTRNHETRNNINLIAENSSLKKKNTYSKSLTHLSQSTL